MTATSFPEFNAAVTELTTKVSTLLTDVAAMQSVANVQVAVDAAAAASASASAAEAARFSPVVTDATTAITLSQPCYLRTTSATAVTVTVPPQVSQAWAVDTEIHIEQGGAGAVTIAAGAGVTINRLATTTPTIAGQYGVVTLKRVAENVWTLLGALGTA